MSKNIRNTIYKNSTISPYHYQKVNLSFSGAIGPDVAYGICTLERIGNTVTLSIPTVYEGDQAAGYISTSEIPIEFRPENDKLINVMIIHGSNPGATITQATVYGFAYVRTTGVIQFGTSINNSAILNGYGGAAVSGSGNGIIQGIYTYSI